MRTGEYWREWEIAELLGKGSFGEVYRIVRKGFDNFTEESALKVIRIPQDPSDYQAVLEEGMSQESATAYFEGIVTELSKEFTLMSSLKGNSNIVSFEDYEVTKITDDFGWEIFIRMELLTPLNTYISQNRITAADVARIGIDICRALELCEAENIIHRDIKPENIFVSKHGDFKLGDFGIAKRLDNVSVSLTKKGTLSYMAPEVYRGLPYTSSVDQYSLGIVLYRLLNYNRVPFMPPYPEEIRFHDREEARARRMNGEVLPPPVNASPDMSRVILKACAFEPADRFRDVKSMRNALEALLSGDRKELELQLESSDPDGATMTVADPSRIGGKQDNQGPASSMSRMTKLFLALAAVIIAAAVATEAYVQLSLKERQEAEAAAEKRAAEEYAQEEAELTKGEDLVTEFLANGGIVFPEYNGETIKVSDAGELQEALKSAAEGSTIELASGNYDFDRAISINTDNIKLVGTGDNKPVINCGIAVSGKDVMLENLSVYITDYDKADGGEMARGLSYENYSDGLVNLGICYLLNTDVTLRYHGDNLQKGIETSVPLAMEGCTVDVSDVAGNYWIGYISIMSSAKIAAFDNTFISNDVAMSLYGAYGLSYDEVGIIRDNNTFKASTDIRLE